jgi:hypothetical protein
MFYNLGAQTVTVKDIEILKKDIENLILQSEKRILEQVYEKIKASEQRTREYVSVEIKRLDQRIDIITWALALIILLFGIPQFYSWFISMRKEKPRVKRS